MRGLLDCLTGIPMPLLERSALQDALGEYALSPGFIGWMGTNLKAEASGGYSWKPDLEVVRTLIETYWTLDLEDVLLSQIDTHILHGEQSERFTRAVVEDLRNLSTTRLYPIEDAGHWLHVDNPSGTLTALKTILSG